MFRKIPGSAHDDFYYADGKVYYKTATACRKVGERAGWLNKSHKKRIVVVEGHSVYEHRLIYFLYKKYIPYEHACEIKHRNGDTTDNRIENLRPTFPGEHRTRTKPSVTGYKLVVRKEYKYHTTYVGTAQIGGKRYYTKEAHTPHVAAMRICELIRELTGNTVEAYDLQYPTKKEEEDD